MKCLRLLAPILVVATASPRAQPTAPEQTPVFRSGVDLVRVDIRVTDENGRPVSDLRPEEVQIKEEGALRPVLLFQHVAAPRTTYAEAAQRTIAGQVSTNQGSPRGHVYVLVFDETHIRAGREQRARAAAERFLRTRVRPGDRVALYSLPGPGPQIEFTADVSRVLRELGSVRGTAEETGSAGAIGPAGAMRIHDAYEITRGHQTVLERHVASAMGASDARAAASNRAKLDQEEDRSGFQRAVIEDARALVDRSDGDSRRFLGALADVIRTLRAVDGRKAVVLFSEGFQTDNLSHELDNVAAAAAQSYSVVYAMDLNARSSSIDPSEDTPRGGEAMTEIRDRLQALGFLTGETGGTLVIDAAAQLDRAMAGIAETSEDYYLLGFMPAHQQQGSEYRRIQVNVTRPGASVSARSGYLPKASVTPADRRRAIDAALRAPFAKQELQVEYTTYTLRATAPDIQRVIVSLAAELPVASTDDEAADVVYLVRHVESGKVAASGSDRIPLPAAPKGVATTGTGLYRVQFELLPGTYLMRALVREPGGLVGSADRRFQVRSLTGPDISASDLVLGSADVTGLPVRAVANAADVLTGVFEVYGRTEAQLDNLTVTADLVPILGGPPPLSSHAELQPVKTENVGASRAVRVELPLAAIQPGEYLVRATVRDGRGTITELLRDVTVRAGTRTAAPVAHTAPLRFDPLTVLRGDVSRRFVETVQQRIQIGAPSVATDELILRGVAAFAKADYAGAVTAFRAAQDSGGIEPALAFLLGWAHEAGGDDRAAITSWRSAIVADPTHVPAHLALVDVYSRVGHPELALQVVRSGLRALPDSPELLDRLARLEGR
jgi:VWFA-related protein